MVRLTREVRFAVDPHRDQPIDGGNGHAGRPTLTGIGHFLVFRLTLEGEIDPQSGYLRNIKDIDGAVRDTVVPFLETAVDEWSFVNSQKLARTLVETIQFNDSLPRANIVAGELLLSPHLTLGWSASEPNMIRLSQKFEFSASHRLHNPALSSEENVALFGKCNNPMGHGHNYELQVTVSGVPDPKSEQIIAVDALEQIVDEQVIKAFDHKHLNLEVAEFKTLNPSVENIARVIYERLAPALARSFKGRTDAKLASVTVWETPKTWAEYSENAK